MRDDHCHIIWGVDDGSPDWETTCKMVEGVRACGFNEVICTPHMRWSDFDRAKVERHRRLRAGKGFMTGFRIVAAIIVLIGAMLSMNLAWNTADLFQALMVVINIPVILILSKPAMDALADYVSQKKQGKNPQFKASAINLKQKTDFWN